MNSEEIRSISIESSQLYYNYLEKNEKGLQEIKVLDLKFIKESEFYVTLKLSSKIYDTESIYLKNLTNNKQYKNSEVSFIQYDSDENLLTIKPINILIPEFERLKAWDLNVYSDLKFLVKRVEDWYIKKGGKILFPTKISKFSKFSKFKNSLFFLKKTELYPSTNQINSINNIFSNSFTYIWGAPGTGKTQFVLAYAALNYLKQGGKIAILAPTNNALEQILTGLLKMTDEAEIDRNRILRMGMPSKNFAKKFPEICEEAGIHKKIQEINEQIKILEKTIEYKKNKSQLDKLRNNLNLFSQLTDLELKIKQSEEEFKSYSISTKNEIIKINIEIEHETNEIIMLENDIIDIEKKLVSIFIKFNPNKKEYYNNQIILIEKLLKDKVVNIKYLKFKLNSKNSEIEFKLKKIEEFKNKFESVKNILISLISEYKTLNKIINEINLSNFMLAKSKVEEFIKSENDLLQINMIHYDGIEYEEINNKLSKHNEELNLLRSKTLEQRITQTDILGMTLDGYIYYFSDWNLDVDHIFVDEAGYANIIKVLTLFVNNIPITLLGDHMQLHPVCEVNDHEFRKNLALMKIFPWAQSSIFTENLFFNSFDDSFSKFINNESFNPQKLICTSLDTTYRFGNSLSKILDEKIYKNGFKSNLNNAYTQVFYIDAKKKEFESNKSRISSSEVEKIKLLCKNFRNSEEKDYVILTPYKKQVSKLSSELPIERNEFKILTVHGSQGREWDNVILSVVDTYDKWFVDSTNIQSKGLNLINTAISRTKKNLFIVCDENYWRNLNDQLVSDLIKIGKKLNL